MSEKDRNTTRFTNGKNADTNGFSNDDGCEQQYGCAGNGERDLASDQRTMITTIDSNFHDVDQLMTVLNGLDSLVYVADIETYELLYINKFGKNIWGDVVGNPCWKVLQIGMTQPCAFCTNLKLFDQNGVPDGVYKWEVQNSVTKRWYECRDQAIKWNDGRWVRLEIATDITDRKTSEQKLRESEEKFTAAFMVSPDIITITTLSTGLYSDVNNGFLEIMGYDRDEVVGKNVLDLNIWVDVNDRIRLVDLLHENDYVVNFEAKFRRKDATELIGHISARILIVNGVESLLAITRDITVRKEFEALLARQEREFREIFNSTNEAIFIQDIDSGQIVEANDRCIEMYGYKSKDDILNKTIDALSAGIDPFSQQKALSWFNLAITTGPQTFSWLARRFDGSSFWVEVSLRRTEIGGIARILAVVRDVNDKVLAEQQMRKSDERYRYLFEHSIDPILVIDASNRFIDCNTATLTLLGADSIDQVVGKYPHELSPPLQSNGEPSGLMAQQMISEAKAVGSARFEWNHQRMNGELVIVLVTLTSMDAGDAQLLLVQWRDITDRKLVEQELIAIQNRYRKAEKIGHVGSWTYDVDKQTFWGSDEALRIYGFDPKYEVLTPEEVENRIVERERVHQALVDLVEKREPYDLEFEIIPKNSLRHVFIRSIAELEFDENGAPLRIVGMVIDITGRKLAEEAMKQSEATQQLILNSMMESLSVLDADGVFLFANNVARLQMAGPSVDTLVGHSLSEFMPHHVANELIDRYRTVIERQEKIQKEVLIPTLSGDQYFLNRLIPFQYGKNAISSVLSISLNITERRRAEEEIKSFNVILERTVAQRTKSLEATNKELEAFSYSVSHDLRAPLRAINGFSRILLEDYAPLLDNEGMKVCKTIVSNTVRMGTLIDDLLAFSRLSRSDLNQVAIDMKQLVDSVFRDVLSREANKNIEVRVGALPVTLADLPMIRQVWVNLISNAIKFSVKSKPVVIEVGAKEDDDLVVFWIRDNGVGFDMKYYSKLFGVFQRLHSAAEFAGTGVGLAIVHRIVTRHNGTVWAESSPPEGACFYFSLPVITQKIN